MQTDGETETTRKYYAFAGQAVAMVERDHGTSGTVTLYYFLTDHLGSMAAVTDNSGALLSEQRYMPFGEVREDVGTVM